MDNLELGFQDIMEFVADTQGPAKHAQPAEQRAEAPHPDAPPSEAGEERRSATMFQFDDDGGKLPARIKVMGVGGGGSNAVSTMAQSDIKGVEFIVVNTDTQALQRATAPSKLQIGSKLTRGRGAGANPEIGRNAALEDTEKIKTVLEGTEMVFITAGMGGGTGTGAAPVIARLAREVGALAVGVVTKPFSYEGAKRMRVAEEGVAELKKNVDALIVIPNERLINLSERTTLALEAFKMSDSVLGQAVQGISDIVTITGHVNVDFADVKTVMINKGRAVMGMGTAKGAGRAAEAAQRAINSPLIEDGSIKGARAVLINVTGGSDLGIMEIHEATGLIQAEVDPDANIIVGTVMTKDMSEEMRVTVIATGFDEEGIRDRVKRPVSLKEYRKEVEKPKKKQESFDFKNEILGIDGEDLDKPTFLRRQAD